MRLNILCLIALLMLAPSAQAQQAEPEELQAVAEGAAVLTDDVAAAEDEAVWDAKRNAVEQAVGVLVRARSLGRDFTLVEDEIESRTSGFVQRWEIVSGSRTVERIGTGKVLRIKVRAVVALLPMIKTLSDIKDVYDDLERPRLSVRLVAPDVTGGEAQVACDRCSAALTAALRSEGFELTQGPSAEVALIGQVHIAPTVGLGDVHTPYGVGEEVAACRIGLDLKAVSAASEDVLFSAKVEGAGESFQSDTEATDRAADAAANAILSDQRQQFVQHILVHWASEREEGHALAVQVSNLSEAGRAKLLAGLVAMRGFRKMLSARPEQG